MIRGMYFYLYFCSRLWKALLFPKKEVPGVLDCFLGDFFFFFGGGWGGEMFVFLGVWFYKSWCIYIYIYLPSCPKFQRSFRSWNLLLKQLVFVFFVGWFFFTESDSIPWDENHHSNKPAFSGWWFQIFFIFIPIWGNDPIWLIFFRWVCSTTN